MMMLPLPILQLNDPDDRETMIRFYEEYHRYMFTVAYGIVENGLDAEDAVQNCWVSLLNAKDIKKIKELYQKPGCELRLFVASCVRNKCFTLLTKKGKGMADCLKDGDVLRGPGEIKFAPSAYETLESRQRLQKAIEGIYALPPYQRQIMVMIHLEGKSTKEISAITGKAENTIRAILAQATERMKLNTSAREDDYE